MFSPHLKANNTSQSAICTQYIILSAKWARKLFNILPGYWTWVGVIPSLLVIKSFKKALYNSGQLLIPRKNIFLYQILEGPHEVKQNAMHLITCETFLALVHFVAVQVLSQVTSSIALWYLQQHNEQEHSSIIEKKIGCHHCRLGHRTLWFILILILIGLISRGDETYRPKPQPSFFGIYF